MLFKVIDTVWSFEPFVVIVFLIEVNKVGSSSSLAASGTVPGKVAGLTTFKTGIVGGSSWWSSSIVSRCGAKTGGIPLHMPLIVLSPVQSSSAS